MSPSKSKKSKPKQSKGKISKKQKQPTPLDKIQKEIAKEVKKSTPQTIIEAIAIQVQTARDARKRIIKEGSVVRDTRGSVIPHPAIKIEANAIKIYTALIAKFQKVSGSSDEKSEDEKLLEQI